MLVKGHDYGDSRVVIKRLIPIRTMMCLGTATSYARADELSSLGFGPSAARGLVRIG